MPDSQPTSQRLESLEARWKSDKGSRVFLQLADEYRRLGRLEDAAKVLEEGLQASPGHLGARVARGRCLVELGRAQEAVGDLEKVIQADPTQMVAYRLLVQAYIRTGDGAKASERLRVYSLLNDADPEIEQLSAQIEALSSGGTSQGPAVESAQPGAGPPATPPSPETPPPPPPQPPEPEVEAGGAAPAVEPAAEPEPSGQAEAPPSPGPSAPPERAETVEQALETVLPSELPPLRAPFPVRDTPASPERTAPHGRVDIEPPEALQAGAEEDPFPEVGASEPPLAAPSPTTTAPAGGAPFLDPFPALGLPEDEQRYRASVEPDLFGGGGVTPIAEPELEPSGGGPFEMAPAAPGVEEEAPGAPAVPGGGEAADPFDLGSPADTAAAPFGEILAPEVEPPADAGEPAVSEALEVIREAEEIPAPPPAPEEPSGPPEGPPPQPEVPVQVAEGTAPSVEAPAAVDEAGEAAQTTEPGEPSEAPTEESPRPGEGGATVTLGRLYLRQGHLQEAEAIFREILERNPDDREARAGLEEVAAQAAPAGIEGKDLLVGFDGSLHGEGLTARKRYALERYLALIRGSGGDVH